jgi:hypothetical protein
MSALSRYSLWASFSTTSEHTRRRSLTSALTAKCGSHRKATWTSILWWSTLGRQSTLALTVTSHFQRNITFGYT